MLESTAIDNITFINDDCLNVLKQTPDKYYSLGIIDPPYGINVKATTGQGKHYRSNKYDNVDWDIDSPSQEYFDELFRVTKNQIIWGANHFISKIPYNSSCWLVWDKDNGKSDFADCELAWTSFKSSVRKFKYRWHGMLQENMRDKIKRIHPTEKPESLYVWILENYAQSGDSILDTHLGSGSIALACYRLGYSLTGVEINHNYYVKSIDRFKELSKQISWITPNSIPKQDSFLD